MKRVLGTFCALALAVQSARAAEPATLNLVAFDRATPVAAAEVRVDGKAVVRTNADGTAQLALPPGTRRISVHLGERILLDTTLEVVDGESAELIFTAHPDRPTEIMVESSARGRSVKGAEASPVAAAPGTLAGRVVNSEDGKPIANARIFIAGTPVDARTDADGRYEIRVPAGVYAMSIVAADYASQTLDGVAVVADGTVTRDVELTPAGLELPEFVVIEPFISGSLAAFVEERRESFAVADVLSIEQISRAGDSDVAGALRRVTGLTLVDGKYVYVRGLGERYSSVLLNGAAIPSPDPSRRVVPLDLFPVEILQGVLIQKSFSAEMPGEFGGGTIQLRTKGIPEGFFFKLSVSQGWVEGTTFEEGLRYRGGTQDWTGFDQVRGLPDSVIEANRRFGTIRVQTPFSPGLTPAEFERVSEDLAAGGFDTYRERVGPNGSLTWNIGDAFEIGEDWRVGYLHSVRWSQGWDNQEDVRRKFAFSAPGAPLVPLFDVERTKTERAIDLSGFLAFGVEYGKDHSITATTTLVRQTVDTAQVDLGFDITESISRLFTLEWEENALLAQQFNGSHRIAPLSDLGIDWQYSRARATRATPNTRSYRYDQVDAETDTYGFSTRSDSNEISYGELTDELEAYGLDLKLPLRLADDKSLTVLAGGSVLDRERDSEFRRYSFFGDFPPGTPVRDRTRPLDRILTPANIAPNGFRIRDASQNSDAYVAEQRLDGYYLTLDGLWEDVLRLSLGAREERNTQAVRTFKLTDPTVVDAEAAIDTKDLLPSASLTWFIDADSQLRAIYAETVSRPDFRELSTSPFIDPLIDTISIGNPDLVPAAIKNYDLRWEYYFSAVETASVALFGKEFVDPIERVQSPATGDVVTYFNVPDATLYGIEFDVYKSLDFVAGWGWVERIGLARVPWADLYLGANYAKIESKVSLTRETAGIATTLERPLQGQSPYVANLQVGWYPEGGNDELSLLYNISGRRISEVGANNVPDVYEESAGQLDLVWARRFADDWKLKLRMRNLLDPRVRFTVGDEIRRELKKGREVSLSLEWSL